MPLASGLVSLALGLAAPQLSLAPQVQHLATRLGSAVFAERELAEAALAKLGPAAARPARALAATHPDAEVRARALRVAERLEFRSRQSLLLPARRVALDFRARPLALAVKQLAAETGLPVSLGACADPERPVTVTSEPLPAWEAVERFRVAANLKEVPAKLAAAPPRPGESLPPQPVMLPGGAIAFSAPVVTDDPRAARWNPYEVVFADAGPGEAPPPFNAADFAGPVRVRALPPGYAGHEVVRGAGRVNLVLEVSPPSGFAWAEPPRVRVDYAADRLGRRVAGAHPELTPAAPLVPDDFGGFGGRVVRFRGIGNNVIQNTAYLVPNPRLVVAALQTDDRLVPSLGVLRGTVVGLAAVPNRVVAECPDLAANAGTTYATPTGTFRVARISPLVAYARRRLRGRVAPRAPPRAGAPPPPTPTPRASSSPTPAGAPLPKPAPQR